MYASRRLVDDLPLLGVVADLDKILVSTSSSELDEKIVENILNNKRRGKHKTSPIGRINTMRYEDKAMFKARCCTGDTAEPSLSSLDLASRRNL